MKLRKGDKVKVISGNWRGKEGVVTRVYRDRGDVLVEGVNLVKKFVKPRGEEKSTAVQVERPLNDSKVMLICPNCQKPSRIGWALQDGKKLRCCKSCKSSF